MPSTNMHKLNIADIGRIENNFVRSLVREVLDSVGEDTEIT